MERKRGNGPLGGDKPREGRGGNPNREGPKGKKEDGKRAPDSGGSSGKVSMKDKAKGKVKGLKDKVNGTSSKVAYVVVGMLVMFGVFFSENIPFTFDRSFMENYNLFLTGVEETNPYPMGRGKTGIEVYDDQQILWEQMYEMGSPRYYVYVYTGIEEVDEGLNEYVTKVMHKEDVPVYHMKSSDVMDKEERWFRKAPVLIEMQRVGQMSIDTGNWNTIEGIEEHLEDRSIAKEVEKESME